MLKRIRKYGDIDLNNNIAKKNDKEGTTNVNFYNKDDSFIDDSQIDNNVKQFAICNANMEDYTVI
jgi:hypothetical protein